MKSSNRTRGTVSPYVNLGRVCSKEGPFARLFITPRFEVKIEERKDASDETCDVMFGLKDSLEWEVYQIFEQKCLFL